MFNLNQFIKESMGAPAWRYRVVTWCRLQDAVRGTAKAGIDVNGNDLTWSALLASDDTVIGALYEILDFYDEKRTFLMARYNASEEQIKDMFQILVGYSPLFGVYMLSAGPYTVHPKYFELIKKIADGRAINDEFLDGLIDQTNDRKGGNKEINSAARSVKADIHNRFGTFTKRFQKATPEEIQEKINNSVAGIIKNFSDTFDKADLDKLSAKDFQLKLSKVTGERRGGSQLKKEWKTYDNLDPSSDSGKELAIKSPILGRDSNVGLRSDILATLIQSAAGKNNWISIYNQAIETLARKMVLSGKEVGKGKRMKRAPIVMTEEEIKTRTAQKISELNAIIPTDTTFMESVLDIAEQIRSEKAKTDPTMADVRIPRLTNLLTGSIMGAIMPKTLDISSSEVHLAELRKEIFDVIVKIGTDDTQKVFEALSSSRRKNLSIIATGEINEEQIKMFIEKFKKERLIKIKGPGGKFISMKKKYVVLQGESTKELKKLYDATGKIDKTDPNVKEVSENTFIKRDLAGSDSFNDAGRLGTLHYIETGADKIDPVTKANISAASTPPAVLLARGQEGLNYTSLMLAEMRTNARKNGTEMDILDGITRTSPIELFAEMSTSQDDSIRPEEDEEVNIDIDSLEDAPDTSKEEAESEAAEESGLTVTPETDEPIVPEDNFPITEVPQQTETIPVPSEEQIREPLSDIPTNTANPTEPITEPIIKQEPITDITPEPIKQIEPSIKPKAVRPKKKVKPEETSNLVSGTMGTLIKLAKDLDEKGKYAASEEIHKVIRKYQQGL